MRHLAPATGRLTGGATIVGRVRTAGGGRWLLLLALVAGLVGMHHLASAAPEGHATSAGPTAPMTDDGHPMGPGPVAPAGSMDTAASMDTAGSMDTAASTDTATSTDTAASTVVAMPVDTAMSMDMAMHLCLAVLVALGLLGLLVLAVAVPGPRPPTVPFGSVVRATARPPPRSAVRLALLCVLRN